VILNATTTLAQVLHLLERRSWTGPVLILDTQDLPQVWETEDGDLYLTGHVDKTDAVAAFLTYELDTLGLKEAANNGGFTYDDVEHRWYVVIPETDTTDEVWQLAAASTPGAQPFTAVIR
jgi:hypothetical protein